MSLPKERKRELTALAIKAGRFYQSAQTDWVHLCYEEERSTDTIPLYENLCFCLALFRSLDKEHFEEGKRRLEQLLSFQLEGGRFPTYMHSYPKREHLPRSTLPLQLIEREYGAVLGEDVRSKLQRAVLPLPLPPKKITSSKEAALGALLLQYAKRSLDPLTLYWDAHLQIYCGPLGDERQRGEEIEPTLFDLFMASGQETFSPRLLKPHPVHLCASLIFSAPITYVAPSFSLDDGGAAAGSTNLGRGFHLFRRVWQEEGALHSFVCQDKSITLHEDLFLYPEEICNERDALELNFYVGRHPIINPRVNGERATLFHLGDRITLTPKLSFTLKLADGEGTFVGRISQGNRPAQTLTRGGEPWDWKISLRTLRRSSKTKVRLSFEG